MQLPSSERNQQCDQDNRQQRREGPRRESALSDYDEYDILQVLEGPDAPNGIQISHPSDARADPDQLGKSAVPFVEHPRRRREENGRGAGLAYRTVGGAVRPANRRLLQRLDRAAASVESQPVDEK